MSSIFHWNQQVDKSARKQGRKNHRFKNAGLAEKQRAGMASVLWAKLRS
jgi:hypothetical protein